MARKPKLFDPTINLPYCVGTALVGKKPLVEISLQVEGPERLEERVSFLDIDNAVKLLADLAIAIETARRIEREE